MTLTPGTRLGVYEVAAQIGAGGMGEVYQATDTKLKDLGSDGRGYLHDSGCWRRGEAARRDVDVRVRRAGLT